MSSWSALLTARQTFTIILAGRIGLRTLPAVSQCARLLHLSTQRFSDDDSKRHSRWKTDKGAKLRQQNTNLTPVSAELKKAAVNAAKSLPGDWTRTAEELVSRLKLHQSPTDKSEATEPEKNDTSLLHTLEIGRSFQGKPRRGGQMQHPSSSSRPDDVVKDDKYSRDIGQDEFSGRPRRVARRVTNYTDLFNIPRLGIFDADKLKKEGDKQLASREPDDLWARVDAENTRRALGALPRNAFEEMIQWTKEDRLWKFPINNEADMDEERKYKFHDHIFLERHLSEFPDKGPIRKFMELVVLGLSMNPWVSVPEKIEHIRWFAEYFRQKQDILEASIGEQGRMKKSDDLLE